MPRKASVVILGLVAAGAIAQGIAACSTDTTGDGPVADAATDHHVATDTGTIGNPQCSGALPVMTALDPGSGASVTPDWSCYLSNDAGFLDLDAGTDADDASDADIVDAADAEIADANVDSGSDASTDAGLPDAEPDAAIDAGSAARTFHLTDFIKQTAVPGISVDFFYSRSAAGSPDFSGVTDTDGRILFTPPASNIGLFVYRVNAQSADAAADSRLGSIQYDNLIPRNPTFAEGQSITQAALSYLLSGILGSQSPAPGSALVVSAARDCMGREVRGGVLELIDGETGQPVPTGKATGQLRSSYFFGGIPTEGCTFTAADKAIWSAINAPVNMPGNTHKYSVRLSGRMHDTDLAAAVLGETPIETWTDQASIVRPYRLTPP